MAENGDGKLPLKRFPRQLLPANGLSKQLAAREKQNQKQKPYARKRQQPLK